MNSIIFGKGYHIGRIMIVFQDNRNFFELAEIELGALCSLKSAERSNQYDLLVKILGDVVQFA